MRRWRNESVLFPTSCFSALCPAASPPPPPSLLHTQHSHAQLFHTQHSHIQLFHTHKFSHPHNSFTHSILTHNISTHVRAALSHTTFPHAQLFHTHTTFPHTTLSRARTQHFLSHTQLSHTALLFAPPPLVDFWPVVLPPFLFPGPFRVRPFWARCVGVGVFSFFLSSFAFPVSCSG